MRLARSLEKGPSVWTAAVLFTTSSLDVLFTISSPDVLFTVSSPDVFPYMLERCRVPAGWSKVSGVVVSCLTLSHSLFLQTFSPH